MENIKKFKKKSDIKKVDDKNKIKEIRTLLFYLLKKKD